MMLSWMTFTLVVGALLVVATLGLDHIAAARRWPTRFVWAGAIMSALAWPVIGALGTLRPADHSAILPFSVTLPAFRVGSSTAGSNASLANIVLIAWLIASGLLFARLIADIRTLHRLRREWPVHDVDGRSVRLTANVGPAVVGVRSMELVLPDWILSFEESLRALVLRHEEEHRAAGDPHLLIGARVAVALMPWNPALWFAARRLRLAIELDCDARVLRAHPSPQRYGMLLLTIAQRRGTVPALAPMLSEPTTQLERRILAMQSPRRHLVRATSLAAALVAAGAIALACSVHSESPTAISPKSPDANRAPGGGYTEFRLTKQAAPMPGNPGPRYPDAMRTANVEGSVLAQFVVNADGTPDMSSFKVVKSTDAQFTDAVKQTLATWKFSPAEVDGRAVRQLLTLPFVFSLQR